MSDTFNAIVAEEVEGRSRASLKRIGMADLPAGDVLVDVAYSTLNYKDGLAITGKGGKIVRKFPLICGIDLAGTVAESSVPEWKKGDRVVVNGWGLGERHNGGYTQRQRLKAEWLVRLPDSISARDAMSIGTAGYTAMLSVLALEQAGLAPGGREVVVTGAAGGVGSVAVALLAKLGYTVIAATGRPETRDYLKGLGASGFLTRDELTAKGPPLGSERWAGGVDSVGGQTLATILAQTAWGGAIAACGLAGGTDLPTTVLPFILRGVSLLGVDSVMAPKARRDMAWARLARDLDAAKLAAMTEVIPLAKVPEYAPRILAGQVRGRVVVDVNA